MKNKKIFFLLKETLNQFMDDNAIKLSASLSYYTIFSLPPLLIIIIYLAGIFFGVEAVRGEIFGQINGLVGSGAAIQIQETIKNIKLSNNNLVAIVGIVTLLFGAMGAFVDLQESINMIWGLKPKPERKLIAFFKAAIGNLFNDWFCWIFALSWSGHKFINRFYHKTNRIFLSKNNRVLILCSEHHGVIFYCHITIRYHIPYFA